MTPPERARRTGFVRSGPGDIGRPPGELRDSPTECGVEEVDDLGEDLIELLGELVAAVLSPPGLVPGLGQVCVAGQDDREGRNSISRWVATVASAVANSIPSTSCRRERM
jgi:hypothetical protein